jgi:dTDP-4-amino-4,6-dideoxygalactose transaminase
VKLNHLENWTDLRRQTAALYTGLLSHADGIESPYVAKYNTISANYYTIRCRNQRINRNELRKYLAGKDIDTAVYYPLALHLQEVFKTLGYKKGDFPESELAQEQVLALPMYPEISNDQVVEVVDSIIEFLKK